jgi:MerR family transcriptional regulator, thiopeptide resistance regulator
VVNRKWKLVAPDVMCGSILTPMTASEPSKQIRVGEDLASVFGFTPGDVTHDPDGNAVHAELFAGDGVIWLHPETETYALASPQTLGKATATMAVMVDDVDEHHRLVKAKGGQIVYEPVDQPYGCREYSARDCEGALWSFVKELDQ